MKKNYFSVMVFGISMSLSAQQTIGFENVLLDSNTYDDGSNGSGGFYENGVVFTNTYFTDWGGYNNGFSVSNMQDDSTAGYMNANSAITASGYNSNNYGVYYPEGTIQFAGQGVILNSFKITNTTYAALSMRDGDSFAKKFGDSLNASGVNDGTNGEDFFRVWTYAHAENGDIIDSVLFYLADYRFSDSSQDYIVNTWETVDLSSITETVYALSFKFESSDMGDWGILTPTYFAIDNLSIYKNLGLNENTLSNVKVYPNPFQNELIINGESGDVSITDLTGKEMTSTQYNQYVQINTTDFPSGIYFVTIQNEKGVFTQKISK